MSNWMSLVEYVCTFASGMVVMYWFMRRFKKIGTLHIDLTDARKDLVRLELDRDIDTFLTDDYVVLAIDSKYADDFFEEKK